jgi:hypothetical protein
VTIYVHVPLHERRTDLAKRSINSVEKRMYAESTEKNFRGMVADCDMVSEQSETLLRVDLKMTCYHNISIQKFKVITNC